jgi:hypothetical protein
LDHCEVASRSADIEVDAGRHLAVSLLAQQIEAGLHGGEQRRHGRGERRPLLRLALCDLGLLGRRVGCEGMGLAEERGTASEHGLVIMRFISGLQIVELRLHVDELTGNVLGRIFGRRAERRRDVLHHSLGGLALTRAGAEKRDKHAAS